MRRRNTKRLTSECELSSALGLVKIDQHPKTSQRCRATHDVPYTLRCTLDRFHISTTSHVDKNGRTW